ncbi:MAG: polyhydroxyalkanoic acid system family protein [Bacteroidales bacterium]|nr:polyhydroxyalkanoic acid system family protein [Bacteroidales bacterium]
MEIIVNHALETQEAKNRILKLADELKKDYGNQITNYSETWKENTADIAFKAMGLSIKGTLNILPNKVTMNGKVPLMAKPFQGQIESLIKTKLAELLA